MKQENQYLCLGKGENVDQEAQKRMEPMVLATGSGGLGTLIENNHNNV